ncbi:MAG: hypothetical protein CL727_06880, partial [Chloroflexi bacterium]|nr:hypothetical protein [Chloroflexota bacterium]
TIPDSVTSIGGGAFLGCNGLASITIPDSVTSIGSRVFEDCSGLTSVTISNNVTSIGEKAFWGCSSLTNVTIPDSVASIGAWAFNGCRSLTSIEVGKGNAEYSSDDGVLFDKSQTRLIQFPFGKSGHYTITDSVTSIGNGAFLGCSSLTSVTIGDSVTSIENGAFDRCSNLTSVTIPDSVTTIGNGAFAGCSSLTSVVFEGNAPSSTTQASDVFNGLSENATIIIDPEATGFEEAFLGFLPVQIQEKPRITTQPRDQNIVSRGTVEFSIKVIGEKPLGCQWYKDGKIIAGANEAVFRINRAESNDTGNYTVRVENSFGMVDSAFANLAIALGIEELFTTKEVELGGSVKLAADTIGTDLNYQWYKVDYSKAQPYEAIVGAINKELIIENLGDNDLGVYAFEISNTFGQFRKLVCRLRKPIDLLKPGDVIWEFHVEDNETILTPSLDHGDNVYFTTQNNNGGILDISDKLYALDGKTGHNKWTIPSVGPASPQVGDDDTIYIIDNGKLRALNNETGIKKWLSDSNVGSSISIDTDGTIYSAYKKDLLAINGNDGTTVWQKKNLAPFEIQGTMVDKNNIYYYDYHSSFNYSTMAAVNKITQDFVWQKKHTKPKGAAYKDFYLIPSFGFNNEIFYLSDALDCLSGEIIHRAPPEVTPVVLGVSTGRGLLSTIIGPNNIIYGTSSMLNKVTENQGELMSYDDKIYKHKVLYYDKNVSMRTVPLIDDNGLIYCFSQAIDWNGLRAFNSHSGNLEWEFKIISNPAYSPVYKFRPLVLGSNGYLIMGVSDKLFALKTLSSGPADSPWPMLDQNPQRTNRSSNSIFLHFEETELVRGYNTVLQPVRNINAPFDYQWYKDGDILPGENKARLIIESAEPSHKGLYSVIVSNDNHTVSEGILLEFRERIPGKHKKVKIPFDEVAPNPNNQNKPKYAISSPTIVNNILYVGTTHGVLAYDTKNESVLWVFPAIPKGAKEPKKFNVVSAPTIGDDGSVYFGSNDSKLYSVDGVTGEKNWEFKTGQPVQSSPSVGADGTVYIGSNDGKIYAINPNGTKKWEFITAGWVHSSPAIGSDGTVYVGSVDKNIYAINPDGTEKWAINMGREVFSSPAIGSDGTIYIGFSSPSGAISAINPDGTERWSLSMGHAEFSSPVIGSDGTVYVGSENNNVYALKPDGDVFGATIKWGFNANAVVGSAPSISNNGIVYFTTTENIFAVDESNGHKIWEYEFDEPVYGTPAIGYNRTIYMTGGGILHSFESSSTGLALSPWPTFGGSARGVGIKSGPPIITQQFIDQTVELGESTEFKVAVHGIGSFAYQWYKNGKQIKGATGTVLNLNDLTKEDEATYSVTITNDFGKVDSRIAQLIVKTYPPKITTQPIGYVVYFGDNIEFRVEATGSGILEYQWFKDGEQMIAAKSSRLKLENATKENEAIYSVRIKNLYGNIVSENVELIVVPEPPTIIQQPKSRIEMFGGSVVTFSVVASGTLPMSYQWRRNGVFLGPASESPKFELRNVQPGQAGIYQVVVSNVAGEVISEASELVVIGIELKVGARGTEGSNVMVTVNPSDWNGQSGGNANLTLLYSKGETVALTAQQGVGDRVLFKQWLDNGKIASAEPMVTVKMDKEHIMLAEYEPGYMLTVTSGNPDNSALVTISDNNRGDSDITPFTRLYHRGTIATLTAEQKAGNSWFKQWLENGVPKGAEKTVTVAITRDKILQAEYVSHNTLPLHTLTLDSENPDDGVAVTVSPSDTEGESGGTTHFTLEYPKGAQVTLTAELAVGGNRFKQWLRTKSAPTGPEVAYEAPEGGWAYSVDVGDISAWSHDNGSDQWDGSAIGGEFGDDNRPGGVSLLDGYVRLQDTGDPRDYGYSDSGSNRKIYLGQSISDQGGSDTILNDGATIHFIARIPTDGPLDPLHVDGGAGVEDYPAGGDGYENHDGGKGNIGIKQGAGGNISFSLSEAGKVIITEDGTEFDLSTTEWHEFWVTIEQSDAGHTVSVYLDGSTEANVFTVTAGGGSDYAGSYLAMGVGSTGRSGALDVAAFDFAPGAIAPAGAGGGGGGLVDISAPGDAVVASSDNSPGGEQAPNAIDNNTQTKYLNFDGANNTPSGLTISTGSGIVTGLGLTSANDAPERDPATYIIWGSNDGENFTEISSGDVPSFGARFERQTVSFDNDVAYTDYKIHFPTTAVSNGCCMQIAEVELLGTAGEVTEPETGLTEPTIVDFGDLSGDVSYEFYFNAVKGGASTAIAGNNAVAIKLDQWNQKGVFGTTVFGVADNVFTAVEGKSVASVFDRDVHVVLVNDTATGEIRLYVDGDHVGVLDGNLELAGEAKVMGARTRIEANTDPMGEGSVMHKWAVYNSTLSDAEIADLAAAAEVELLDMPGGVLVGTEPMVTVTVDGDFTLRALYEPGPVVDPDLKLIVSRDLSNQGQVTIQPVGKLRKPFEMVELELSYDLIHWQTQELKLLINLPLSFPLAQDMQFMRVKRIRD